MLLKLCAVRLLPLILLRAGKERKRVKRIFTALLLMFLLCMSNAVWLLVNEMGWKCLWLLPLCLFPHWLFYGFGIWMLFRCIFQEWSKRVWNRIYILTIICIFLGILLENYINPQILRFVFENFK